MCLIVFLRKKHNYFDLMNLVAKITKFSQYYKMLALFDKILVYMCLQIFWETKQ